MVLASQTWKLSLPGCSSLKEKRSVIRSIRDRLSSRFNVSVAETGFQDVHSLAELSIPVVASDGRLAESVLDKADRFVESHAGALIIMVSREVH